VIRERLGAGSAPENEAARPCFPPAAIEAIDELFEVALQVLAADTMEGSAQPVLEISERDVTQA
jgi:hypothetical protein